MDYYHLNPLKTRKKKKKNNNITIWRVQSYISNNFKDGDDKKTKEVNENFVIVKISAYPYEDFKKSMIEMITENKMVEAEDLEQLLICFMSLNSRNHHAVILEAFTEILQELFSQQISQDLGYM